MLRYLRRADDVTGGGLRWGILTNGRVWRLYFQGALSVAEDFLEIDLGKALQQPDCPPDLLDDPRFTPEQVFRLFALFFGREAFIPAERGLTLHDLARQQGKLWEERVAKDLSKVVFGTVYPTLVRELAARDPARDPGLSPAYLETVRQGVLIFLYRLLFALYAEDRNLLPDEHGPYRA